MRKALATLLTAANLFVYSPQAEEYRISFPESMRVSTNTLSTQTPPLEEMVIAPHAEALPDNVYQTLLAEPRSSKRKLRTLEDAHVLTAPYASQLLTILLKKSPPGKGYAAGHGLLLSEDGFFLAPNHVVENILYGKAEGGVLIHPSKGSTSFERIDVLASWKYCDLALGKIHANNLPPITPLSLSSKVPRDSLPLIGTYLTYPPKKSLKVFTPLSSAKDPSVLLPGIFLSRASTNAAVSLMIYGPPTILRSIGAVGYPLSHSASTNHPHHSPFIPLSQTPLGSIRYLIPVVLQSIPGDSGTSVFDEDSALIGMLATGDSTHSLEGGMIYSAMIRVFLMSYQQSVLNSLQKKSISVEK